MIFVGIDWGERNHDVCVIDPDGQVLAKGRVVDGLAGVCAHPRTDWSACC
ncbi:MAG: transposase [Chloroflexi bacterium]|nr:transposase [Chloroflexota bacterium]